MIDPPDTARRGHDESPPEPVPQRPPDVAELVAEGQGLVRSLALQVFRGLPFRMDLDDLIAYGQLGLTEAAQKYDPRSDTRFTTFAYYRIRGAIYDGVSKMNWTSRARIRRMRFQRMADDVLENENRPAAEDGRGDAVAADAAWLGRVTERLAVVYLATEDDDSAGGTLADAADPAEPPSKVVASRELQQTLRVLVGELAPEARRLINSIYFEGFTLTEAAQRFGISKSWASRLHAKSLDQLAKSLRRLGSD